VAKKTSKNKVIENKKTQDLTNFHMETNGQSMTTNQGIRVEHTEDSLRAGLRGPTLMDDFHLREKIMSFDHERIPERIVHARGAGAHGVFELYESQSKITKAKFLQDTSRQTPVFVRFSTVAGSRGSADTARDVRGFAVKFYTDEGNFDLVGNNMPVFFIQDGIKFPDLIHSVKPEPHNEIPQASSAHDTFWDFISLSPESTHMIMWHLSDRAIPRSFSTMEGFGVHTFRLVNDKGQSRFVKFHWKPLAGIHSLVWDEAVKIQGKDCDFHRRSLFDSIEEGNYPEWELGIQVVEEKDEFKFDFDLLDPTKIIPEELVPVQIIGRLTLNRNPDNFFAETEQVAFCVGNLVPGIDVTNDPLMQARLFSYLDTQLSRLGSPNFTEIPINRPVNPISNHQIDGHMRTNILKSRINYFPNSLGGGSPRMSSENEGGIVHFPQVVNGEKTRERASSFNDHYSQAALFFNSMAPIEKKHLIDAAIFELSKVENQGVRDRMVGNLINVDLEMAKMVADQIGVDVDKIPKSPLPSNESTKKVKTSPALSMFNRPGVGIKGRCIAILMTDGFSNSEVNELQNTLALNGAKGELVAMRIGAHSSAEGEVVNVKKMFKNTSSVLYDAVYIPGGIQSVQDLTMEADAIHFINEAFKHHKTIGFSKEAEDVMQMTSIGNYEKASGVLMNDGRKFTVDYLNAVEAHRHWDREIDHIPA
jgi:catalase